MNIDIIGNQSNGTHIMTVMLNLIEQHFPAKAARLKHDCDHCDNDGTRYDESSDCGIINNGESGEGRKNIDNICEDTTNTACGSQHNSLSATLDLIRAKKLIQLLDPNLFHLTRHVLVFYLQSW